MRRIFGTSLRKNIIQGSSEDLGDQISVKYHRDQRSFKDLRKIFDKDHSKILQRSSGQRSIKDLPKIFVIKDRSRISEIKDLSKTFGRYSLVEIIQGSLRSTINQGTLEDLSYHRSFEDLRLVFVVKVHSRIFGRSYRWNII